MTHEIKVIFYPTEEAAKLAEAEALKPSIYSETYTKGISPCRARTSDGAIIEGFCLKLETYK